MVFSFSQKTNKKFLPKYSHLSNNCEGWNKRGGGPKVAKSINVEVGIDVEGGIFQKNLLYKCNKREVEGEKILEINKRAEWIFVLCRVEFSKIGKPDVTFIREMRVG